MIVVLWIQPEKGGDGAVTVTAQRATLTLAGVSTAPSLGALTVTAQQATVVLSAVTSGGTLTALTVTAQTRAVVLSAVSSGGTLTPITVPAQTRTVVLSGVSAAPTLTALTVAAQQATLVLSGVIGSITGGPVTVAAQPATLTLTGVTTWAADDFDRSDRPLDGEWVIDSGTHAIVSGNKEGVGQISWPDPFPADAYMEVDMTAGPYFGEVDMALRWEPGTPPLDSLEGGWWTDTESVGLYYLYDGAGGSIQTAAPLSGRWTMRLEVVGSLMRLLVNGVEVLQLTTATTWTGRHSYLDDTANLPDTIPSSIHSWKAGGFDSMPVLGDLTVTAQPATVVLSGVEGTPVVEGDAVTVTAQPATIILAGVSGATTLAPLVHGAQPGTVVLSGVSGGIAGGPVTVAAQPATVVLAGQVGAATIAALTVAALPATVLLAGQSGTVTLAAVTVAAQPATLVLSGVPGSVTVSITVNAQPATIVLSAVSGQPQAFVAATGVPPITSRTPGRIRSQTPARIVSRQTFAYDRIRSQTPARIRSRQSNLVTSGV